MCKRTRKQVLFKDIQTKLWLGQICSREKFFGGSFRLTIELKGKPFHIANIREKKQTSFTPIEIELDFDHRPTACYHPESLSFL